MSTRIDPYDETAVQTALRLDSITYVNGRTLLDDVSVTFPAGKVTALSGKVTLTSSSSVRPAT